MIAAAELTRVEGRDVGHVAFLLRRRRAARVAPRRGPARAEALDPRLRVTAQDVTNTIVMVGLPCAGQTAESCFFKRGCEERYSCRTSSFSGTAHRLGRNRYVGTNHLPGGATQRRPPRRRRIGPP